MLKQLRKQVYAANMQLPRRGLTQRSTVMSRASTAHAGWSSSSRPALSMTTSRPTILL